MTSPREGRRGPGSGHPGLSVLTVVRFGAVLKSGIAIPLRMTVSDFIHKRMLFGPSAP
jgi:hypothetical protein